MSMRQEQHYVNFSIRRPAKLHAGWLEHKSSLDSKWKWYWCTLRGNVIYILKNETDNHDQHIGTLALDSHSRFDKRDGNHKIYRFDLHTGRRVNKFRTKKFSDRELWRAFVEGIVKGFVSDNIDLPEKLITDIRKALNCSLTEEVEAPPPVQMSASERRGSVDTLPTFQEGFDLPDSFSDGTLNQSKFNTTHYLQPVTMRPSMLLPPSFPPLTPNGDCLPMKNKLVFYSDPYRNNIPSWFFKGCSRELALDVLTKAAEYNMGNTLMRSRPNADQNNLVISKMMGKGGPNEFSHYEVQSVTGGYVIVLDDPHKPEKSLDDLMNFFKLRSGTVTTRLMTCNDLKRLNIQSGSQIDDPYDRSIRQVELDDDNGEHSFRSMERNHVSNSEQYRLYQNTSSLPGSFSASTSSSQPSAGSMPPSPPSPPPLHSTLQNSQSRSEVAPALPPNHPSSKPKSQQVHPSPSNSSQSPLKSRPAVFPKPKLVSHDNGLKSPTDTDTKSDIVSDLERFFENPRPFKNAISQSQTHQLPEQSPDEDYVYLGQYQNDINNRDQVNEK